MDKVRWWVLKRTSSLTHSSCMLQLSKRSGETVFDSGHLAICFVQLFLESCDVTNLWHFAQDWAKVQQGGLDLSCIIQHNLHKRQHIFSMACYRQTVREQCGKDRSQRTDLKGMSVAAQTFSCFVRARRSKPRLRLSHPFVRAVDHLLMLLKPCMHLNRNRQKINK